VRPAANAAGVAFVSGTSGASPTYTTLASFSDSKGVVCWTTTTSRACRVLQLIGNTISFPVLNVAFYAGSASFNSVAALSATLAVVYMCHMYNSGGTSAKCKPLALESLARFLPGRFFPYKRLRNTTSRWPGRAPPKLSSAGPKPPHRTSSSATSSPLRRNFPRQGPRYHRHSCRRHLVPALSGGGAVGHLHQRWAGCHQRRVRVRGTFSWR